MESYDPHIYIKQWKEYMSRKNISVPAEVNVTIFFRGIRQERFEP